MPGLVKKSRTFWRLPLRHKLLFFEAFAALTTARLMILLRPFPAWRSQISRDSSLASPVNGHKQEELTQAYEIGRAIEWVNRVSPFEFLCLPQAIAARWMLSRRSIPAQLYIGTLHSPSAEREFHAWLKVGRLPVTGACDEADYAVLEVPPAI